MLPLIDQRNILKSHIYNSYYIMQDYFPDKLEEIGNWIEEIATKKLSKYDVVIFMGTNEGVTGIDEKPAKEILIYNKDLQKAIKAEKFANN